MSRVFTQQDIDEMNEDQPEPIHCPFCLDKGYRALLAPKILMPNEQKQEDYDSWLECPRCYKVIGIHEGIKEEIVTNKIETVESPFDDKLRLETVHKKRTNKTGKKIVRGGKKRKKAVLHEDTDIDLEMRQYGTDNVRVLQDSNP